MATNQSTIRHATVEDIPCILQLIQDLAAYEHESSAVQATEQTLRATLVFAASPTHPEPEPLSRARPARVLLAFAPSDPEHAVGMALYFYNYSTWRSAPGVYLEDLFVREEARGAGHGRALLRALAKEVVEMGGARLEWSVLKWNEPSIRIYEKIGAKKMDEWVGMRVDGAALKDLAES